MRPYEVMIIFTPTLEDAALQERIDRSAELVRARGATVERIERWGRRRLAYELQHQRDGYYVVMETKAEPATMAELDRSLHLADEVLRHKVIRVPDRVAGKPRRPVPSGVEEAPMGPGLADEAAGADLAAGNGGVGPGLESGATVAANGAAEETTNDANGA